MIKEVRPITPWTFRRICAVCKAQIEKEPGWDYRGLFACKVCAPNQKSAYRLFRKAIEGGASADLRI